MASNEKLQEAFGPQLLHAFEKLREGIRNPVASLASWGLGVVSKSIDEFKTRTDERGLYRGSVGVQPAIDAAERSVRRLEAYFAHETQLEEQDAIVYSHYLQTQVDKLKTLATEIDEGA